MEFTGKKGVESRGVRVIRRLGVVRGNNNMLDTRLIEACSTDVKKQDALSKLSTGLGRAEKAVEQRDKDLDKCFYWWNMFFNGKFPAR